MSAATGRQVPGAARTQGHLQTVARLCRLSVVGVTLLVIALGICTGAAGVPAFGTVMEALGVGLLAHIFVYVLNDVVDLPIDRTDPRRKTTPLVCGRIAADVAWAVVAAAGISALLTAALLNREAAPYFIAAMTLLAVYDVFGKRLAVPFAMDVIQGLGWAALVLWGADLAGGPTRATFALVVYVTVYITFVNAVHGGLRDLDNDRRHGARTTPILLGASRRSDGCVGVPPILIRFATWCQLALVSCAVGGVLVLGEYPLAQRVVVASFAALVSAIGYVILRGALNADTTSTDSLSRGTVHIILQLAVALVLVLGRAPWWLVAVALVTYLVPWAVGGSLGTATRDARAWIRTSLPRGLVPSPRDVSALVRSASCVAAGGLVFLGAYLGADGGVLTERVVLLAIAMVFIVAYAEALNDIVDVAVDSVDKPWRPLPAGRVTMVQARVVAAVSVGAGIAVAFASDVVFGLAACVLAGLSTFYSLEAKSTVLAGNVLVAILASSPLLLGAVAAGHVSPVVVTAELIVFLFMLAFEVLKVGKDEFGDATAGISTLATRYGARCTSRVFWGVASAFVVAVLLPPVAGLGGGTFYLLAGVSVGILPVLVCGFLISGAALDRWASAVHLMKYAWFPGIAVLVLLRV